MRLYNTLSRRIEEVSSNAIGLYVCGITPYDSPHLGHARAAVIFDAFVRYLRGTGRSVVYVRNITDIDDKIIERARELRIDHRELTTKYLAEYNAMTSSLGCASPDHEPRVSLHIPETIALVERLIALSKAYAAKGSVYFSVRSYPPYGQLARRAPDDMVSGEGADARDDKRDPLDFALWKATKEGEPSWPSPWGEGRPGWHLECSAMAMKYLGETFEIHGGGNDLLFPHHENEKAQSEAATGRTYARIWMHNGMVTIDGRKMSKSLANAPDFNLLLEKHGARLLRYFMLSNHFASPLDFSEENLLAARRALERFDVLEAPAKSQAGEIVEAFGAALEENFNTPQAFGILFEAVTAANKSSGQARDDIAAQIRRCGEMIGLDVFPEIEHDVEIEKLIDERNAARREKNFARSDEIRQALLAQGVILEDGAGGTRWRR